MTNLTKTSLKNKFNIVECDGILSREELERVLMKFPVNFYLVKENIAPQISFEKHKKGKMDVYHSARVIDLYPPERKRLSNACVTNWDFPFKPDNIMDDQLGLRCCYHPKLSEFGIDPKDKQDWDEIEIDIHKYSKEKR